MTRTDRQRPHIRVSLPGDLPWALEPDAWDDTCRHDAEPPRADRLVTHADGTPAGDGGAR